MSKETMMVNNFSFYMDHDVISWLFHKYEGRENAVIHFSKDDAFSFDIIDQPFHCVIKSIEGEVSLSLYIRSELGVYPENEANLSVVLYTNGDKPKVTNRGGLGGDIAETILYFLKSGVQLREEAVDKNLMEQFPNLHQDSEGILVRLQNDELTFDCVSGRKRPSLACRVLFGGIEMKRPYQDEIMDSWMGEMMSFEDKLETAEAGDEDAMGDVAITYLNGDEDENVEPDAEKAVYWFRKQAERNHPTGCYNLAIQYLKGEGIEQSFEQALYWMEQAEKYGDEDAPAAVKQYRRIIELQKEADSGDAKAKSDLSVEMMSIGSMIGGEYEEAFFRRSFELAIQAEKMGSSDAHWVLALAYEHGRGVDVDEQKAIEHYRLGAESGNAACQHNLGCCYLRGDGVSQDMKKGFDLCMKSASQGYGLAMKTVGTCYQFGNGVDDSMKKAIYWYEKALETIDDPELAQKVMLFKMLPDFEGEDESGWEPSEESYDEQYSEMDDEDEEEPLAIDFSGKIFVLTGLDAEDENQITDTITARGGIIKSSTVLKTDYLIYDERFGMDTGKHKRAIELNEKGKNIQLIPKRRFLRSIM